MRRLKPRCVRPSTSPGNRLSLDYRAAMTKDEMFTAIAAQRRQLADTLDGFTDADWNTPSLCVGWAVRDVVGHLVSILEIPMRTFIWNAVKSRDFDRYANVAALGVGVREPKALAATFRSLIDTRFAPPVVGPIAPLTDLFVHTRDIERPLGRPGNINPTAQVAILNYVCGGRAFGFVPSKRTKGLRFEATDMNWSSGAGPTVSGQAEAIMMAVTGRRVALADLTGAGAPVLGTRLGS
jgi:uncharacterized protein (TIGR03083 family)